MGYRGKSKSKCKGVEEGQHKRIFKVHSIVIVAGIVYTPAYTTPSSIANYLARELSFVKPELCVCRRRNPLPAWVCRAMIYASLGMN